MKKPALIVLLLWLAVMLVVGLTDARAVDFLAHTTASRGSDPWIFDSCIIYVQGGWNGANLDSTRRYTTAPTENLVNVGVMALDTLARFAVVSFGDLDPDYNPAGYAKWWFHIGSTVRETRGEVDFSVFGISATASVDYDSIADIINAACGGGTGINVVRVYARDTTNDVNVNGVLLALYNTNAVTLEGQGTTEPPGYFDFSLDDATYLGRAHTPPGYLMETANDTIVVSGPTQDTLELYSFVLMAAPSDDSCVVLAFTDKAGSTITAAVSRGADLQTRAGVFFSPIVAKGVADAFGVAYITLPRTDSTRQHTLWDIEIKDPRGNRIASVAKYNVPAQQYDTLFAEQKN